MKSSLLVVLALMSQIGAVQLDNEIMRHHHKHHRQHPDKSRDNFDHDPDTVTEHDDRVGTRQGPPAMMQTHMRRHNANKDAYDHDPTTASVYDDGNNINKGNPYMKAISSDEPLGPPEKDLREKISKNLKASHDAEEIKTAAKPAGETAEEGEQKVTAKQGSDNSFSHAIPKDQKGKDDCHAVGAKCDADAVRVTAAKEAAEEGKKTEVDVAAEEIAKEEVKKETEAAKPEKAVEGAATAAAQVRSKHHH